MTSYGTNGPQYHFLFNHMSYFVKLMSCIDVCLQYKQWRWWCFLPNQSPRGQSSVVGGLKWWLSRGCKRPLIPQGGSDLGEAVFGIVQILARLVSRVSRPQFCWGLAILCDPPFFSGYIEFGGVVVKFYSSVEITLYLLADFLLQYVTLFQSRDIVKNLVSL